MKRITLGYLVKRWERWWDAGGWPAGRYSRKKDDMRRTATSRQAYIAGFRAGIKTQRGSK